METKMTVAEEMKRALYKRAVGYETEEMVMIANSDGTKNKVVRRKRHIPGDPKAMMQYMALYGDEPAK